MASAFVSLFAWIFLLAKLTFNNGWLKILFILNIITKDIRFPTSNFLDGSDAMNPDPDYSAAYVILKTDHPDRLEGHGLTFTIGRGNELCVQAINALAYLVLNKTIESFTEDMSDRKEDTEIISVKCMERNPGLFQQGSPYDAGKPASVKPSRMARFVAGNTRRCVWISSERKHAFTVDD